MVDSGDRGGLIKASGGLAESEVGSEASGLAGSTGVVVNVVDRTLLGRRRAFLWQSRGSGSPGSTLQEECRAIRH